MDNCTFSNGKGYVYFGSGCSIDEATISNSDVVYISVSEVYNDSFTNIHYPAATIKTLKLNNLGRQLQVTNDGDANIYISNCNLSEQCGGSGSGLFVITNSTFASSRDDVPIDYFSGTAAELEKYLHTLLQNN